MSDTVVDSSVVAKWILPEADSADAQFVLSESAQRNEHLIVLDLAFPEVANAVWKRFHRGLTTLVEARTFLDSLLHCPVQVEPATRVLQAALEIAAKYQRSIYDILICRFDAGPKAAGHHCRPTSVPGDSHGFSSNHPVAELETSACSIVQEHSADRKRPRKPSRSHVSAWGTHVRTLRVPKASLRTRCAGCPP